MADVFTQVGEELVADIIDGTTGVPANWYGHWGTGAGAAAKGDTALTTPGSESRVAATMSQPSADINRFVFTITADAGKTITESGVFSASTGGILLFRSDFTGVVLGSGDKIEFTYNWTHA